MELLEGETLHSRLVRGPLEISDLVAHAVALSDALDTAHGKGFIHRDEYRRDAKTVLFSPYAPGLFSVPIDGGQPRKLSERRLNRDLVLIRGLR